MPRSYQQMCPIARTLDVIGDRWALLLVRELLLGATKFNELRERVGNAPARTISERLKALEDRGIIERRAYSAHPPRASYHLTEAGESLKPVLEALFRWGIDHAVNRRERRTVIERLYNGAVAHDAPAASIAFPDGGYAPR